MRLFALLVICLMCTTLGVAAFRRRHVNVNADPVEKQFQVTVKGTQRTFYVYVPSSYTGNEAFPLVVFFHGATDACQSASNFMIAGFTTEQVARKFLLATPCGLNKVWEGPTDLPFANTLLDTIIANYNVSASRIYASGFSNGAGLTEYLGCRMPDRWSGGLAIAAGWVMDESPLSPNHTNAQLLQICDSNFAAVDAKVNVIKLQGSVDPNVVPYGRDGVVGMRDDFYGWALRNGCKGSPTTTYEDNTYKDESFKDCPDDVKVRLVFLYGVQHTWVHSNTFNYNTVILDEFDIKQH